MVLQAFDVDNIVSLDKKLGCHRETVGCFVSLNILLSH